MEKFYEAVIIKTFRSYIKQLYPAAAHKAEYGDHFVPCHGTVYRSGLHPTLSKRIDLILHKGDKRRYDYGNSFARNSRDLVTERFSCACRHYRQSVVALKDVVNDLLLPPSEGGVTKYIFKHINRLWQNKHSFTVI
ncbi:hypothetical protein SDC9_99005 [bioreactor metagenome]|uniref:Uncharacterized protein n=1 Tax=bioreactor metagenome TaxID=1076179 RepID=A0A645AHR3_9ZZZZ